MTITILIVEDQQPMRELLRMMVADFADIVGECTDGAQALAAYRRLRPDWVLMDVGLPSLDGIAAAQQIIESDSAARIVMVTNHNDAVLRHAAQTAGACGYVLKENLLELPDILKQPKL